MSFAVRVLGSGTSVPSPTRRAPAYLVRGDGAALLLDCGPGAGTSLAQAGVSLERLDGILLTHLHLDHSGDLAPLLFALANPVGPPRTALLPIWGPPGTADLYRGLQDLYGSWVEPRLCQVEVTELGHGGALYVGSLRLEAFAVEHGRSSLAYRMSAGGAAAACYSGDSGPCEGLVQAARGVELFLCECAALEEEGATEHLSAREAGRLAARAGCGRLVLTHLYDHVVATDPLPRARESYAGPIELAEDGMELVVGG